MGKRQKMLISVKTALLVCAFLCFACGAASGQDTCGSFNSTSVVKHSPGLYHVTNAKTSYCEVICYQYSPASKYVAVQASHCLCVNSSDAPITLPKSDCTVKCKSGSNCPEQTALMYKSQKMFGRLEQLHLSYDRKPVYTGEAFTLSVTTCCASFLIAMYAVIPGQLINKKPLVLHQIPVKGNASFNLLLNNPGPVTATVYAAAFTGIVELISEEVTLEVKVRANPYTEIGIECPGVTGNMLPTAIALQVYFVTDDIVKIEYDGGESSTFVIPDPVVYHVPPWLDENPSAPQLAVSVKNQVVYGSRNMVFRYHGYIKCWTVETLQPSVIQFTVWRPDCTSGIYCYRSNRCTVTECNVDQQPNTWSFNVNSQLKFNQMFNLAKRSYPLVHSVKTNDYSTFDDYKANLGNTLVDKYTEQPVKLDANLPIGYHTLTVPDNSAMFVRPGDIVGVRIQSGEVRSLKGISPSVVTCEVNGKCIPGLAFNVKATVVRMHSVVDDHDYSVLGTYDVRVSINYDTTMNCNISVQESVANVTLLIPVPVATTNESFEIRIGNHSGEVGCVYETSGYSNDTLSTEDKNFTVIFDKAGSYTLQTRAQNMVSEETVKVTIEVEDPVRNITIMPGAPIIAVGSLNTFALSIDQGTQVNFTLRTGDGKVIHVPHNESRHVGSDYIVERNTEFLATIQCKFENPGEVFVESIANNRVSNQSTNLTLRAQEPLSKLKITGPFVVPFHAPRTQIYFTIATGTEIEYKATFGTISAYNMTFDRASRQGCLYFFKISGNDIDGDFNMSMTLSNLVPPFQVSASSSIYVEYNLTDISLSIDKPVLKVNDTTAVFIHFGNASRASCILTYGDGSNMSFYIRSSSLVPFLKYTKAYFKEGLFQIRLYCYNNVSEVTVTENVIIQYPIADLTFEVKSPIPLLQGVATAVLAITPGSQPLPTNPFYRCPYNGNNSLQLDLSAGIHSTVFTYNDVGDFSLICEIWNMVSSKTFKQVVVVDVPVTGLGATANKRCCRIGTTFAVTTTVATGSRINLTYTWNDQTPSLGLTYNESEINTASHSCNRTGSFWVEVLAKNSFNNISIKLSHPLIVQHPVPPITVEVDETQKYISTDSKWSATAKFNVYYEESFSRPTDPQWKVDFGDGNIQSGTSMPGQDSKLNKPGLKHLFQILSQYSTSGDYNVTVAIFNCLNNVTAYQPIVVYEEFTDVFLSSESMSTGKFSGNVYPLESPVAFTLNATRGSHPTVVWDYGDGGTANTSELRTEYAFSSEGNHPITATVINVFNSKRVTSNVVLQRSIKDIAISCKSPVVKNAKLDFTVNPGTIGTDACYFIDFKDSLSNGSRYLFLGNTTECDRNHREFSLPNRRYMAIPTSLKALLAQNITKGHVNFTVSNVFQTVGEHFVNLTVTNQVSSVSYVWRTGVVRGFCTWPSVDMSLNKCFQPMCTPEGYKIHQRGKQLVIKSQITVNCSDIRTEITWSIFTIANDGAIIGRYPYDLSKERSAELVFLPRSLNIGLYKIILVVSMVELLDIRTTESVTIKIVPTPLECKLDGGRKQRLKWGTVALLDARSSLDPDIDRGNDSADFNFFWMCRRSCETFPVYNANFTGILEPGTSNCTDRHHLSDGGGCYRYDMIDNAGLQQELSPGLMRVRLSDTYEHSTIEWHLTIKSGNKMCTLDHTIDITSKEPPNIIIECVKNCGEKVDKGNSFSLTSFISNYPTKISFRYRWSILRESNGTRRNEMQPYNIHPKLVPTGFDTPYFSISNDAFSYDDAVFKFALSLKVFFQESDDNYGEQLFPFTLNSAPVGGHCELNQREGVGFVTKFYATCPKPFVDSNHPILYSLQYRLKPKDSWSAIVYDVTELNQYVNFLLPPGVAQYNNSIAIKVIIKDGLNAATTLNLAAKVTQGDEIKNLISGNDDNLLASIEASHDLGSNLDVILGLVNVIDNTPEKQKEGNSSDGISNKKATQLKLALFKTLENLTEGSQATFEQHQQALGCVEALTRNSEQVGAEGMVLASQYMESGVAAMSHFLGTEEMPSTQIVRQGQVFLNVAGNLAKVLIVNEDREVSKTGVRSEEAVKVANQVRSDIKTTVSALMYATDQTMVAGEANVEMETETSKLTVMKKAPENIDQGPINIGFGAQISFPPVKEVYDNDTTSVSAAVLVMQDNPLYEPSDNKDSLPVRAPVMMVGFFQGRNEVKVVGEITSPLVITHKLFDGVPSADANKTNGSQCHPSADDPKKMVVHQFVIPKNSSFHIKVSECLYANKVSRNYNVTTGNSSTFSSTTSSETTTQHLGRTTPHPEVEQNDILSKLYEQYLCSTKFSVYIKLNKRVEYNDFDFHCQLPIKPHNLTKENDTDTLLRTDLWTCFQSNVDIQRKLALSPLKGSGGITVYFGVVVKKPEMSCANGTDTMQTDGVREGHSGNPKEESSSYQFTTFSSQCKIYDEDMASWVSTNDEEVGPLSNQTHVQCNYFRLSVPTSSEPTKRRRRENSEKTVDKNMIPPPPQARPTTFGCGFSVPVNTINPSDSAFLKLDSNPVIFAVMVAIICMYLVIVIWARRADKDDALKVGTTFLADNDPSDRYMYELTVYTGSKAHSGTTSKVSMVISGLIDETPPRLICDDTRPILQRGDINSFIMAVPSCLGTLTHLRVWHDNSGRDPSWFFSRLVIEDLQNGQKYFFIAEKWLAIEEDGMIDRIVPLAGGDELTEFNHLFWTKARKDLFDGHLWFSVATRPPRSSFTRVQRLTCCVSLLFSAMLANILFYGTDDGAAPASSFTFGPITFTVPEILTGIYSSLIVFPINLIIAQIFRYSKPPKTKAEKLREDLIEKRLKGPNEKRTIKELEHARNMLDYPMRYYDDSEFYNLSVVDDSLSVSTEQSGSITVKRNDKKKKFRLPYFGNYIAYFLCLATCAAAFYYTVEVGGVFGAAKSNKWMMSFVVSCIQDILLSQPIKVLLMAIFYALVIKSPVVDDDMDTDPYPKIQQKYGETNLWKRKYAQYQNMPQVVDKELVKKAKENKAKEAEMNRVIFEIVRYVIFLYLLMMVGYGNKDPWGYQLRQTVAVAFEDGHYGETDFGSISDFDSVWDYLDNAFLPGLYGGTWYNGKNYWFTKNFASDRNNFMMGGARLRQVRTRNESCEHFINVYFSPAACRRQYSFGNEDRGRYNSKWRRVNESAPNTWENDTAWYWQSADEIGGIDRGGEIGTYSGGGFVADLTSSVNLAERKIRSLKENDWIDRNTRAIFLEFNLFNPHLNLHTVSNMLIEFDASGGAIPTFDAYILRLDRYSGSGLMIIILAEIVTYGFTIYFIVVETRKIANQKCDYFREFWNVMELIVILLLTTSFVIYVYRIVNMTHTLAQFRREKTSFINLQRTCLWDEVYGTLISMAIFVATVKSLKLLQFNKKMSVFGKVLKTAASPILSYGLIFLLILVSYAFLTWVIIGYKLPEWKHLRESVQTLFSMMLNKFDFISLEDADPTFAPIIFFSFTVLVNFMMINFFLTMLMHYYSIVQEEIQVMQNRLEFVNYITRTIKGFLGIREVGSGDTIVQEKKKDDCEELVLKARFLDESVGVFMRQSDVYDRAADQISHFLVEKVMSRRASMSDVNFQNDTKAAGNRSADSDGKTKRFSNLLLPLLAEEDVEMHDYSRVLDDEFQIVDEGSMQSTSP